MCNECGKNGEGKGTGSRHVSIQKAEVEEVEEASCKFCEEKHREGEVGPYVDPFPQIPPFPPEGICGMYPIRSTCKKEIMKHMLKFERRLTEQAEKAKVRVKMREYKRAEGSEDSTERVVEQLEQLDADIQQLKHRLAVESLRHKYGTHAETCPCYSE